MWPAAASSSPWRYHLPTIPSPIALISFSRWHSGPPATTEDFPQAEHSHNPSSTHTDSLFGLSCRKERWQDKTEGDDIISESSQARNVPKPPEPPNNTQQENYFSRAWSRLSEQKNSHKREGYFSIASQMNRRYRNGPRFAQQQEHPKQDDYFSRANPGHKANPRYSYAPRFWEQDRIWQFSSDLPLFTQERFVIVSYNILASTYAHQHSQFLYKNIPPHILDWHNRKRKIIFELGLWSPDVICLQEVDRFEDLQEELANRGYVGLYKVRTGKAPDGCAIFWRKERFNLLQEESLEFRELGMRDNVAQLCVLQSTMSGNMNNGSASDSRGATHRQKHCLVVGNIHVLYNPKRGDIKLGQLRAFLERAHQLSSTWHGAPVVIGGDFNSTPMSAVYDFLATSELEVSGLDRWFLSGQISSAASSMSDKARDDALRKSFSPRNGAFSRSNGSSSIQSLPLELERHDLRNGPPSSSASMLSSEVTQNNQSETKMREGLESSLTPRYASRSEKYATEFANIATEVLGVHFKDSLAERENSRPALQFVQVGDNCNATGVQKWTDGKAVDEAAESNSESSCAMTEGELVDNIVLSKTIKILETSLDSQVPSEQTSYINNERSDTNNMEHTSEGGWKDTFHSNTANSLVGMESSGLFSFSCLGREDSSTDAPSLTAIDALQLTEDQQVLQSFEKMDISWNAGLATENAGLGTEIYSCNNEGAIQARTSTHPLNGEKEFYNLNGQAVETAFFPSTPASEDCALNKVVALDESRIPCAQVDNFAEAAPVICEGSFVETEVSCHYPIQSTSESSNKLLGEEKAKMSEVGKLVESLSESSPCGGVGEGGFHHKQEDEKECFPTASFTDHCHQSPGTDWKARESDSFNNLIGKLDTGTSDIPKSSLEEGSCLTLKKQNAVLEMSELVKVEFCPDVSKEECLGNEPAFASPKQHAYCVGTCLHSEGEAKCEAYVQNELEHCSDTDAFTGGEKTFNAPPGIARSSIVESTALLEENKLKSSHSMDSKDEISCVSNFLCKPFSSNGMAQNYLDESKECDNGSRDKYEWSTEELETATGSPGCTTVRHSFNLRSVYSEIQGPAGTRDAKGEPLITTYNHKFRGTVDYIWHSDGLKPVKVLETLSEDTLRMNRGLPSQKWGSDHLAIACELAFTSASE